MRDDPLNELLIELVDQLEAGIPHLGLRGARRPVAASLERGGEVAMLRKCSCTTEGSVVALKYVEWPFREERNSCTL